jgi:hypothetical protein
MGRIKALGLGSILPSEHMLDERWNIARRDADDRLLEPLLGHASILLRDDDDEVIE